MKYTIKRGDTLSQIAKDNNTTVSELAKINSISNPNLIYAGATLEIPDAVNASSSPVSTTAQNTSAAEYTSPYYETNKPVYSVGADVTAAKDALNKWEASTPEAYKSAYSENIAQVLDKILNRESFSYDFNADPIYRQYREQYMNDGKRAMKDAMGNAAALTGGYGNSYAASAGSAAYNSYLEKLGEIVPSLMEAAYKRYSDGIQKDRNDLETLLGLDESDYSRYRDGVEDYKDEGEYLLKKLTELSDADYNRFLNELKQWNTDRDYGREVYENERDAAYERERDAVKDSQWEKEYALDLEKLAASLKNSSTTGTKSSSSTETTSKSEKLPEKDEKKAVSYKNCSTKAREYLDILASPEAYDSSGNIKVEIRNALKESKKQGEISSEEYSYIINSVN